MNELSNQKITGYKLKNNCVKYLPNLCKIFGAFPQNGELDATNHRSIIIYLETVELLDIWLDEVYFKEPKLPIINKYEGKYHKDSHISYGCAELPLEWFMSDRNRSMTSITLSSGAVLSKSDIEQIKEYLIYQNNK